MANKTLQEPTGVRYWGAVSKEKSPPLRRATPLEVTNRAPWPLKSFKVL